MTVTYTAQVANCRGLGCFIKLLLRWRGSIYKLVWLDLLIFLLLYYSLNAIYRLILTDYQKNIFESVVKYCENYNNTIPLSFVLGFYVTIVMSRWWNQYISIPWPDSIAVLVSSFIHGQDERGRLMRRTIMRYVCLCLTMSLRNIAPRVKKRFPTFQHFVEAGILIDNERDIIEDLNEKFPPYSKHWLPIVWAAGIVTRARREGRIRDDYAVKTIIEEMNKFRGQCGILISYDTISVPLVYTQVVTLAVYTFFLSNVMAKQFVDSKEIENENFNHIDLYFPIFTTLQFFFYMGWLKVAESLINPFGEDDDDFEVNWMIDRDLQVSYIIVDEMHHEHPELIKDQYWDEMFPDIPNTIASQNIKDSIPLPSTANVEPKKGEDETVPTHTSVIINDLSDQDDIIQFSSRPKSYSSLSSNFSTNFHNDATPRVSTVATTFKKFFSREGNRLNLTHATVSTMPYSVSGTSLSTLRNRDRSNPGENIPITDQVIEEVDEHMAIASIKPPNSQKNVRHFFEMSRSHESNYSSSSGKPLSDPIDIPKRYDEFYGSAEEVHVERLVDVNDVAQDNVDKILISSPLSGGDVVLIPETLDRGKDHNQKNICI